MKMIPWSKINDSNLLFDDGNKQLAEIRENTSGT